ncbi:heme ABC transporter ATP-binding protein [Methyloversatilis universalis]|uniref:heme ABC transporter ATP-binding protein n=1 Tax=Methyloversatilis universalis TaxID=378211 RepID=UPI0003685D1E|nr:heme ABC transporter ATP-binding protein [Methyloversatilis universalis]
MLSAHHLGVRVGGRRLLDELTLALEPGQLCVLVGPNGAGKTTLLRALSGDLDTADGEVRYGDRPVRDLGALERARLRAVLAQHQRSDLDHLARDVVALGRYPHHLGRPTAADRAIANEAMALTGCSALAHRVCGTLSGGEQARVHLARALAQVWTAPPGGHALLLDEPVAALDIAWQHRTLACAREFARQRGTSVLAIVHDLNLAARYADRMVLLTGGRLREDGPPDQVLRSPALADAFGLRCRVLDDDGSGRPLLVAEAAD